MEKFEFLDNPVFLCGAPRSGTTLLHQLFDSVPGLVSLPVENHIGDKFFKYRRLGEQALRNYFYRDYIWNFDLQILYNLDYLKFVDSRSKTRFGNQSAIENLTANHCSTSAHDFQTTYANFIKSHAKISIDLPFRALALAHCLDIHGADPSRQTHFIHRRNMTNETQAIELATAFPNAKFIHLLRDPRTRYLSARQRAIRKKPWRFKGHIKRSQGLDHVTHRSVASMYTFELAKRNRLLLGDQYLIVRYEDLTSDRHKTMRKVADFLNLTLHPELLEATRFGVPSGGNSSFRQDVKGIEQSVNERIATFEETTSKLERQIVHYYAARVANKFDYNLPVVKSLGRVQCLPKLKYERLSDYIKNRMSSLRGLSENFVFSHNVQFEKMFEQLSNGNQIEM